MGKVVVEAIRVMVSCSTRFAERAGKSEAVDIAPGLKPKFNAENVKDSQ